MKKFLITTTLLAACGLSAIAQSKFTVANNANIPVTFKDPAGAPPSGLDGVKVQSATAYGGPHWAALYMGLEGTPLDALVQQGANKPIGQSAGLAGIFSFGTVTTTFAEQAPVLVQVRGWREADPGVNGHSDAKVFKGSALSAAVVFGTQPNQIGAWQLNIPEPTSMMLAGLGLSGLLFLRRRK